MASNLLQIRKLTVENLDNYLNMETGIEDDYVARIFPSLVTSKEHVLYGLFEEDEMLSIGGYSIFAKHYAMLGRLRSDQRYLGKGYATKLIKKIIDDLHEMDDIYWIGANTLVNNTPARKVLEKLGLPAYYPLTPLLMDPGKLVNGTLGPLWPEVKDREDKRNLLLSLKDKKHNLFSYECYYPFPIKEYLFEDEYLDESHLYVNEDQSRFFTLKKDQKGELYALLVYPWEDPFEAPGLWNTVNHHLENNFTVDHLWIDLTDEQMKRVSKFSGFEVKEPWLLHGKWLK